jgi:uncharacterized membrane protein
VSDPAQDERHARSRTMSRTMAFTDASVAIALTLLILPLTDAATGAGATPIGTLLRDQRNDLLGFFISFAVIIRFWTGHRRSWEGLADYDETTMGLNFLWLLTVVFLPFATALLTSGRGLSRAGVIFYLLTLLVSNLTSTAMTWRMFRRPELRLSFVTEPVLRSRLWQSWFSLVVLVVAIGLAALSPVAGLLALLALTLARLPTRLASVGRFLNR